MTPYLTIITALAVIAALFERSRLNEHLERMKQNYEEKKCG